jgi:hypothetical protein
MATDIVGDEDEHILRQLCGASAMAKWSRKAISIARLRWTVAGGLLVPLARCIISPHSGLLMNTSNSL